MINFLKEMSLPDNLIIDLKCPITLDWLVEPITVSCCQKVFSKNSLIDLISHGADRCPLCQTAFDTFDVYTAPVSRLIANLVEYAKTAHDQPTTVALKSPKWTAVYYSVSDSYGQLAIDVTDYTSMSKKTLFILLADKSGSMSGKPIRQLRESIRHIYDISRGNDNVIVKLIMYDSNAYEIDLQAPPESVYHKINNIQAAGGTYFKSAFELASKLIKTHDGPCTAAFLTDGQGEANCVHTVRTMLTDLLEIIKNPVVIHSIGFGEACDKTLLDAIRTIGTEEGTFRYAEATDSDDALCSKITGIFDISCLGETVDLTCVPILNMSLICSPIEVKLSTNTQGCGHSKTWTGLNIDADYLSVLKDKREITKIKVIRVKDDRIKNEWLSRQADLLASDILACPSVLSDRAAAETYCHLFQSSINTIGRHLTGEDTFDVLTRIEYLKGQIAIILQGQAIDRTRLTDLKYTSMFKPNKATSIKKETIMQITDTKKPAAIRAVAANELPLKNYTLSDSSRNKFAESLFNFKNHRQDEAIVHDFDEAVLAHVDLDGNNAIMLMAYLGLSNLLNYVCNIMPAEFIIGLINKTNNQNESAFTLAVKKRGYDKTIGIILNNGGEVIRRDSIIKFAIDNGYKRTATLIDSMGSRAASTDLTIDCDMKQDYIGFMFKRFCDKYRDAVSIDDCKYVSLLKNYLTVTIMKYIEKDSDTSFYLDIIAKLINRVDFKRSIITIDLIADFCIPNKPDSPDIEKYMILTRLLSNDIMIGAVNNQNESLLFTACKKGSMHHVEYFYGLDPNRKVTMELRNDKGNSCLWVASYMRYPCIMTFLIDRGANVNHINDKGNLCLAGICERGGVKSAELLISRGIDISHKNHNGDTVILIACRNGQHEVLKMLLNYVDDEFVNYKAHIDGFNAIMASAEANRPECIRVLVEYGISLSQKTDITNTILKGATPLHIAVYYGRMEAVETILNNSCKEIIDMQDYTGCTALHIAIIQGYPLIAKRLIAAGIDTFKENNNGELAMSYARTDTLDIFNNPLMPLFENLSKGKWPRDLPRLMCIITEYSASNERMKLDVNITDTMGFTPLMYATIYGQPLLIDLLISLGADPLIRRRGVTAIFWMLYLRNMKISKSFKSFTSDNYATAYATALSQRELITGLQGSDVLYFSLAPGFKELKSLIYERMSQDLSNLQISTTEDIKFNYLQPELKDISEDVAWNAKICAIYSALDLLEQGSRLSRHESNHKPLNLLAISIYANSNLNLNDRYMSLLYDSLCEVPSYTGEVYMSVASVDRLKFLPGAIFAWPAFISASTLWRVALDNVPQFTSKSRKGVVFIVKSIKSAKLISKYSMFSGEAEAVLMPCQRYIVKAWYHGDVIALGQENIRSHSFSVDEIPKDGWLSIEAMKTSDKSLIIELAEVS